MVMSEEERTEGGDIGEFWKRLKKRTFRKNGIAIGLTTGMIVDTFPRDCAVSHREDRVSFSGNEILPFASRGDSGAVVFDYQTDDVLVSLRNESHGMTEILELSALFRPLWNLLDNLSLFISKIVLLVVPFFRKYDDRRVII
jgi:hypothetical protein